MVQEADLVRLRRPRYVADIPDALYMVDEKPRPMGTAGVDVLAAAFPGILIAIFLSNCLTVLLCFDKIWRNSLFQNENGYLLCVLFKFQIPRPWQLCWSESRNWGSLPVVRGLSVCRSHRDTKLIGKCDYVLWGSSTYLTRWRIC